MRSSLIGLASVAALALAGCGSKAADTDAADNTAAADTAASDTMAADAGAGAGTDAAPPAAADAAMPTNAQGFADAAAASDMFEIESSKLAKTKAKNADVKSFAEMMIKDHTASSAELKTTAAKATPPVTVAPKLMADQQALLDSLKAADADFDSKYAAAQVTAHQKALALLQGYAASGDSEPLKGFAGKLAPKVSQHLDKARTLPK